MEYKDKYIKYKDKYIKYKKNNKLDILGGGRGR